MSCVRVCYTCVINKNITIYICTDISYVVCTDMRYTAIQCDTIHTHAVSKRCRAELEQIPAPQHVGCYSISRPPYGESLAKAQIFMDLKDTVAVSHFGFPFWCSAGSIFPSWARRLEASWDAGHGFSGMTIYHWSGKFPVTDLVKHWGNGRIWLFQQSHDIYRWP